MTVGRAQIRRGTQRLAALGLVVVVAAGCGSSPDPVTPEALPSVDATTGEATPTPEPTEPTESVAPTEPVAPTESPAAESPSPKPSKTGKPAASADGKLKRGESGPEVLALQRRLDELGYWNGKADGEFGALTVQAVYALQKAAGISRDGTVGPKTQEALDKGVRPSAKSTDGRRIEIDLKKQLLMVVDKGEVTKIFNTSTGSNERYEHDGQSYLADTPKGRFKVQRQINDWRYGPLGPLYRPKYFNGGIAVHGAHSIPAYPASHGCARLSIAAMDWIWKDGNIPVGTSVWVY